jgi:hypothetical protein
MNKENLKDTIKAILEYSEITSCETKIDLDENIIKLDFSAEVKELTPSQRLRQSIIDVLGRGISEVNKEFLTSGYTPSETQHIRMTAEKFQSHKSKNKMVK